jgi:hypothetical protein
MAARTAPGTETGSEAPAGPGTRAAAGMAQEAAGTAQEAAGTPKEPAGPLALDAAAREVVLEEIAALGGALRDPAARAPYEELAAAVAGGEVPPALAARLERVLEMSLATGRARRLHGAQHEAELQRLFFKTPGGGALRRSAEAANRALAALAGQRLEALVVTALAPGVHRLRLDTDRCQLTLEVSRDGVEVVGLEVEI